VFERVSERVGEKRFDFINRLALWRNLHFVPETTAVIPPRTKICAKVWPG
jgi:hypothetical protein